MDCSTRYRDLNAISDAVYAQLLALRFRNSHVTYAFALVFYHPRYCRTGSNTTVSDRLQHETYEVLVHV
jgi:hypothetical protein